MEWNAHRLAIEPAFTPGTQPVFYPTVERWRVRILLGLRLSQKLAVCLRRLLQALRLARLCTGRANQVSGERINAPRELSVFVFQAHGEPGRLRQHWEVSFHATLDVTGLVAMATQAPDEDAITIEIVWLKALLNRSPKPVVLDLITVANFIESHI